jgi:hypothetical protein
MQTSFANQHGRSNDPVWQFLAEYSLSEFLSDHDKESELSAGLLFQTMRESSIPIERIENIEVTFRRFAREALMHFKQGRMELPGRIRIFCNKKMIDEEMKGGWGFFVIERSRDSSTSDWSDPHLIDLYLYKEGE